MLEFFYGAGFAILLTLPAIGISCWIISNQWKMIRELNNRIQAPNFREFAASMTQGKPVVKPPKKRFSATSWVGVGDPPVSAKEPRKDKPADPVLGRNY